VKRRESDVFLFSKRKLIKEAILINLIEVICSRMPAFILVLCKHAVTRIIVIDPALKSEMMLSV
jgi:hypothetical protein